MSNDEPKRCQSRTMSREQSMELARMCGDSMDAVVDNVMETFQLCPSCAINVVIGGLLQSALNHSLPAQTLRDFMILASHRYAQVMDLHTAKTPTRIN